MNDIKHTPGPWEYSEYWVWKKEKGFGQIAYIAYGRDREQNVLAPEQIANGHLIAAAPDLLESLQEMCKLFEKNNPDDFYWTNEQTGIYENAILSIKKAEGKQ